MAGMNISVDEALIAPIVQAQIEAAIARELGSSAKLIESIVSSALNEKVDAGGKFSSHSYDNKYRFLTVVVQREIQRVAKEAVVEYLKSNSDLIRSAVRQELLKSEDKIVAAFVQSMVDAAASSWRLHVSVTTDN